MTHRDPDETLRSLLQAGDPATDGSEPSAEETAWLRRLTLNQAPERRPWLRWLPVTAAAAAVFAAVLLAPSSEPPLPPGDLALEEPLLPRRQQIQFATENGTRIIWVLDPELKL
jgi:hypothetical protein